jgi:hypothetical protein
MASQKRKNVNESGSNVKENVNNDDDFNVVFNDKDKAYIKQKAAECDMSIAEFIHYSALINDVMAKNYEKDIAKLNDAIKELRVRLSFYSGKPENVTPTVIINLTAEQRKALESLFDGDFPEGEGKELDLGMKMLRIVLYYELCNNLYFIDEKDKEQLILQLKMTPETWHNLFNNRQRDPGINFSDVEENDIRYLFKKEFEEYLDECL